MMRMQFTMNYNFGDILLVPFPYTDQTGSKKRPAVVVNSTTFNQRHSDLILMAITGRVRMPLNFGEMEIIAWQKAGLLKTSLIKPVFTTIEESIVIKKLGSLEISDENNLRNIIQQILG